MRGAALLVPTIPFLLGVALSVAAPAAIEPFPLADLRPGMRGFALTVLEGEEPDTFAVEIVGVTAGSGPGQHLILVKALDERIARTGIAAGMSGSPVFIDGRIAAALAYAYVGATEPIGAAVPFDEMRRGLGWSFERDGAEEPRSRRGAGHGLPPFPEWRAREAAGAGAGGEPRGDESRPVWPPAGMPAPRELAGMRRLDLPMAVGGALGGAAASERSWWDERGIALLPALGGGAGEGAVRSAARAGRATLRTGDAIAIDLISGDMAASAIGTVTWSEGDRVLALGHGFLTALPIEVPVSRARIHAIIPTRGVSFKIGAPVEEVGTLIADREPGVAARLGRIAPRIPFSLRLRSGSGAFPEQAFDFSVARNEILSPALIALAARSAVTVYGYGLGAGTLASRLEILFDDGRRLAREDLLRTLSPGQAVGEA
ncbi:MAG: hypothetical protein FJY75_08480, partial [Candidatus Eisenbacteria bacterium]|nr:hypothetical protein [Candidatus Eisenbacteria bacterium]